MRSSNLFGAMHCVHARSSRFTLAARARIHAHAAPAAEGKVGASDIGGVVSSSKGPEAGVWVIAETTDLPTRYIKEVVTDDQRALSDSRSAEGEIHGVGTRLRPGGFAESGDRAGKTGRSETGGRARCAGCRAILSRQLLVRADGGACGERISRDGRERERDFARRARAGGMDSSDQDRQLRVVPSARKQVHAHDSGDVRRPRSRAGVDSPRSIGTGGRDHDRRTRAARCAASCSAVRRLDHAHQERRIAGRSAAASARRRNATS